MSNIFCDLLNLIFDFSQFVLDIQVAVFGLPPFNFADMIGAIFGCNIT